MEIGMLELICFFADSVLAEDAIKAAIRDFESKRQKGHKTGGTIDVSQSAVTGKTEATVNI